MSDTLEVLASETMNDEQAKWIGDGLEMVVGVLGCWSRSIGSSRRAGEEFCF
jgi:hypothetical protein